MTVQYYDSREDRPYTTDELIAICNGQLRPYPESWYDTAEDVLAYRDMCLADQHAEDLLSYEEHPEDFPDWYWAATYRSPVQQWRLLRCDLL